MLQTSGYTLDILKQAALRSHSPYQMFTCLSTPTACWTPEMCSRQYREAFMTCITLHQQQHDAGLHYQALALCCSTCQARP